MAYQGRIREKPESEEECRRYLKSYETEPACTVTAVVVTNTASGKQVSGVDVAKQWFHAIPDDTVTRVIAKGDIMYCCGGFMVDEPDFAPYLHTREGTEDSIIGLPLQLTLKLIEDAQAI